MVLCSRNPSPIPAASETPPADLVEAARQHLAQTLGIPLEQILWVTSEPVLCRERGKNGAIPGWRIGLLAQTRRYAYQLCGQRIIPPQ
jgi:hypothetical protein